MLIGNFAKIVIPGSRNHLITAIVGWAKPAGRANARVDGVPTIDVAMVGTA
jgi:hypothetical protein